MAHGFLSYEEVSGDRFWQNAKWLGKQLDKIRKAKIWPLSDKKIVNVYVSELQNLLVSGQQKKMAAAPQTRMLGAGSGDLATRSGGLTEKNPTDIDVKTGKRLPPGGPRLPGSAGGPSKGGGFTDIPGIASAGLNAESFFQKAQTGVGASGEYLTKAQRIADFRKSQEMRSASAGSPPITGDSGLDIVAAVNRNTQMIVSLVDAVKEQTKIEVQLSEKESQNTEKLMLRAAARQEESDLEKGKDLSGFLTPERFKKKEKNSGGGGGGDDSLLDFLDVGLDLLDIGGGRKGKGGRSRVTTGRGGKGVGKGGGIARSLGKASKGGGLARGAAGLGKGLLRNAGPLALLGGAFEFSGRKAEGQSNLQAGVGTAASVAGGLAGAAKGAAMGAALGSVVPGLGTAVGGILGGLIGGFGGSALAGGAADLATGAFANGGLITQPTLSLMGEGNKAEGVFPLEGTKGKKTFKMFGEGLLDAQLDNEGDFAKLQSKGLKQYYETEGGFEKMGNILGNIFKGIGGVLSSLVGGAANAAGLGAGGGGGLVDPTISGDEEEYLMRLMIAEAGGEGEVGMAAVGRSVLNRAGLIQSGEVRPGMFNAKSGSIMDVINASGQYQPVSQGKLKRDLTPEERARAKKALEMARNQASLRGNLEAQGMASGDINKIMASTGFRTKDAFYDKSQEVNVTTLGAHRFNTAGNAKMLTPGAEIKSGAQAGTGMATFGETGRVFNKAGYVHGHFQSDTGTKADVVNDVLPIVRGLLNSGVTDVSITSGETFRANMSDAEIRGLIEKGIAKHTHSGTGKSVDIFVPKGTKVPFPLADVKNTGGRGGITGILPGSGKTWVGHLTPDSKSGGRAHSPQEPNIAGTNTPGPQAAAPTGQYNIPGAPELSNVLNASNPNTGTSMMATSAQVAMAGAAPSGAAPTIINNYYGGGSQSGGVNPNGVSAGIGMDQTGTSAFQPLKIMALT